MTPEKLGEIVRAEIYRVCEQEHVSVSIAVAVANACVRRLFIAFGANPEQTMDRTPPEPTLDPPDSLLYPKERRCISCGQPVNNATVVHPGRVNGNGVRYWMCSRCLTWVPAEVAKRANLHDPFPVGEADREFVRRMGAAGYTTGPFREERQ